MTEKPSKTTNERRIVFGDSMSIANFQALSRGKGNAAAGSASGTVNSAKGAGSVGSTASTGNAVNSATKAIK
jgi:hypothetical protein